MLHSLEVLDSDDQIGIDPDRGAEIRPGARLVALHLGEGRDTLATRDRHNTGGGNAGLAEGRLADVAPTLLELMGLPQPAEMTGVSLMHRIRSNA